MAFTYMIDSTVKHMVAELFDYKPETNVLINKSH